MNKRKKILPVILFALCAGSVWGQGNDVCVKSKGDRTLVVQMKAGQRYTLNMDPYSAQQMPGVLAKVMSGRSERVVFLKVEKEVTYGELQNFEDRLFQTIPGLKVGLLVGDDPRCVTGMASGPATALQTLMVRGR